MAQHDDADQATAPILLGSGIRCKAKISCHEALDREDTMTGRHASLLRQDDDLMIFRDDIHDAHAMRQNTIRLIFRASDTR